MLRELARILSCTGRMPRAAFWKFVAVWLPVAILFLWLVAPDLKWLYYADNFFWVFVIVLPLLCAATRRVRDTGEDAQMVWATLAPFSIFYFLYFGMPYLFRGSAYSLAVHGNGGTTSTIIADGSLIVGALFGVSLFFLFYPAIILATIATLLIASQSLGQCLVPSEALTNKYGPNPLEVSP